MTDEKIERRKLPRARRGVPKERTPASFTVRLTEEDFEALRNLADANFRSASQQAAWLIVQAVRAAKKGGKS